MAKKPDTPCAGCGRMLWSGPGSLPADKRLCRTCRASTGSQTLAAPAAAARSDDAVDQLGARGRRLWDDATTAQPPSPVEAVLLEEACRIADRLDRLDAILRGDQREWLRLRTASPDGTTLRVIVTGVLAEARQQALALKSVVGDLRQAKAAGDEEKREASLSDDLAARRTERRRAAGL